MTFNLIEGTNRNDTLTNNKSGISGAFGYEGNDTYVVNNISNSATYILDDIGNDKLQIKGANGNDLLFFFDCVVNEDFDEPTDTLFIIKNDRLNDFIYRIKKYTAFGELDYFPNKGVVGMDYFMGNTNNRQNNGKYGTLLGTGNIETIAAVNSNGVKYVYNVKSYISAVMPKVKTFLINNGYNSVGEVLASANQGHINALFQVYKNTPITYTVTGSSKADNITGSAGNDTIKAGYGNDVVKAAAGNDRVWGGAGNDTLYGSAGDDLIYGDDGNDTLRGGNGNDTMYGGNGSDTIYGEAGNDKILAGKGNDKINTGSGNDIVYFNSGDGADILYKGTGSDTLQFNNFATSAKLKSGLKAKKSGYNLILSYTSKDKVTLYNYYKNGSSVTKLKAKDGSKINLADYLETTIFNTYTGTKNKINKITGSAQNDLIKGNNKNDILNGGNGNDKLYGYAGNDTIHGNNGNDYIVGGDGNDKLYGDAGRDTIKAGKGNDYIDGGAGNDIIYGDEGKNTIIGGAGNDKLYSGTGADTFVFAKDAGVDYVYNSNKNDILKFNNTNFADLVFLRNSNDLEIISDTFTVHISGFYTSNSKIDKIVAKDGTYSILRDAMINIIGSGTINGTNYNEIISGSDGDDVINGGKGNDFIAGGAGDDTMSVYNNDIFLFNTGDGNDTINVGTAYNADKKTARLFFYDASLDDLTYEQIGNDIVIHYSDDDSVTLKNYKLHVTSSAIDSYNYAIIDMDYNMKLISELVQFNIDGTNADADGKIIGTAFNDIVTGTDDAEIIYASTGNDIIDGGDGTDIFLFFEGDGDDIVSNAANDVILFGDINLNLNPLFAMYDENDDIVVSYGVNDSITLENFKTTQNIADANLKVAYLNDEAVLPENPDYTIAELSEAVAGWLSNTNDLVTDAHNNGDYTSTPQELVAAYWTDNPIV